jgi:hypothetical protein
MRDGMRMRIKEFERGQSTIRAGGRDMRHSGGKC